jgi:alanyl-tRNA synthetase
MFYDLTGTLNAGMTLDEYLKADDEQKVVEIWNNVFMQFLSKDGKVVGELPNKNVDTGSGFERLVAVIQGKRSVFDTDIFQPILSKIEELAESTVTDTWSQRVIADHIRTSVFMIADGVLPSNTDRGYILRRLLRRAVRFADSIDLKDGGLIEIAKTIQDSYRNSYPETTKPEILQIIEQEENKFRKTLQQGLKEFESGTDPFVLFSSYGFPIELTEELAKERGKTIDRTDFDAKFKEHQEKSRAGSTEKFKGGLAGTGEMETKYHSATHLLHQALRDVLGDSVQQKGSNITAERLRFDFTFDRKMTDDEKKRVEDIVNEQIALDLPVKKEVMKKQDAEKTGALHFFGDKYGDEVNVYYIGDSLDTAYSKEFCGGPHVARTGVLGTFKIQKEEASSAGIRRIKAVLE